jgi:hypothetical protein
MNPNIIFPVLTIDERVIGQFEYHSFCNTTKFIALLTNYRLVTRTRVTICCWRHHSSYTAISLESIHRIDEYSARPKMILYSTLWIFWILVFIAGLTLSLTIADGGFIRIIGIIVSSIPLLIMSIVTLINFCYCVKHKFIDLQGTFGSLKILLCKQQARLFEANLSEQIFQAKIRLQQTSIPMPSAPTYYLRNENLRMNGQMETVYEY